VQGWARVLLIGASNIKADAIVGVGDGTKDTLVSLTGQAPLTGTLVVSPVDRLQRHSEWSRGLRRGVGGCGRACPSLTRAPAGGSLLLGCFSLWPPQGALWSWETQVLVSTLTPLLSGESPPTHDGESKCSLASCEGHEG
jgi:hypothetical protein